MISEVNFALEKSENSRQLRILLICFLLLAGLGIGIEYFVGYDARFSLVAFLMLVLVIYKILTLDTLFFSLTFYFFFSFFFISVSLVFIEGGAFLVEVAEQGYPIGSGMKYLFYTLLLLTSQYYIFSLLFYPHIIKNINLKVFTNKKIILALVYILYIGIVVYLLGLIAKAGSPLWLGMDRIDFWNTRTPPGTAYIQSTLPQWSFLNGLIYATLNARHQKYKKYIILLFIVTLLTQFLHGNKFSYPSQTVYFFYLPTLCKVFLMKNIKIKPSIVFAIIISVFVVLALVVLNYMFTRNMTMEAAIAKVGVRFVLQGQLWWVIDRYVEIAPRELVYWIKHLFGFGVQPYEKGIYHLMFMASPALADMYYTNGGVFTAGYPSIVLLSTGYLIGTFFIVCIGTLVSILLYYTYLISSRGDLVAGFFVLKFYYLCFVVLGMGNMHLFFEYKFIIFFGGTMFFTYAQLQTKRITFRLKPYDQ